MTIHRPEGPLVVVPEPIADPPWSYEPERALLADRGVVLEVADRGDRDRLLGEADAVLVCERLPVADLDLLRPGVPLVCYGVGMNAVDVEEARRRGHPVHNVPDFCTTEVATHAVALLLALNRRLDGLSAAARRGEWELGALSDLPRLRRLAGQCVGVVGLGRIGSRVAAAVSALGCRVVGYDPFLAELPDGVERLSFPELLTVSDAIVLCASLTSGSARLLDRAALAEVKPGVTIVNVARGGLVEEDALVAALRSGRVAAAGLDVREHEPPPPDDPFRDLPNVLLTPHIAAVSQESDADLHRRAAEVLCEALSTAGHRLAPVGGGS